MFLASSSLTGRAPLSREACRLQQRSARRLVRVRAGGSGDDERQLADMFEKELRRRGLDSGSSMSEENLRAASGAQTPSSSSTQRTSPRPAPSFQGRAEEEEESPQLARSRALNSEGLEGFIPRATELVKLGLAFSLYFLPAAAVVAAIFFAMWGTFGDSFVHGGVPATSPPPYIDPDMLLAAPTADPMVPL